MADASSIRSVASLPTPTLRNEGSIRYNNPTRRAVVSNGNAWVDIRPPKVGQVTYNVAANADLGTKTFFVANKAARILSIQEVHATAGTDSSAVTMQITKETATGTAGTGTALLTSEFNLKGTANTVQAGSLNTNPDVLWLNAGEKLSVKFTGTLTALAGVQVTIEVEYPTSEFDVQVFHNVNGNAVDECFFVAPETYEIVAITEIHGTAGTDSSAVNVQVVKDTGTNAPGAGTDLLTNNSNAGFDLKATAQVAQAGILVTTPSALVLAAGDRLSVDYAGTVTAVADVVITVTLRPLNRTRVTVSDDQSANADDVTECFFIADRPCQILGISEVHSAAGTDAGSVTLAVTKDTGTQAPGAGTSTMSGTFNLKGTANTVQNATLTSTTSALVLAKGDRLSILYSGIKTALAGVVVTVSLEYISAY